MTKYNIVKHLFRGLACDDTQQQKPPFQVVLVDIRKAAEDKRIHCVEMPLESEDLAFVALSYRWGELDEKIVNTKLGYLASVTSFDLEDFYLLCRVMTMEPDLKSIKYVWVDAICVDQTNYERRKATIHRMSNIYEKAAHILAVPDLHRQHLKDISKATIEITNKFQFLADYIYYLIQGNSEQLIQLDNAFLNDINLPEDPTLRQLLTKYTDAFTEGFTEPQYRHPKFATDAAIEHLYNVSQAPSLAKQNDPHPCPNCADMDDPVGKSQTQQLDDMGNRGSNSVVGDRDCERLHHCDSYPCPLGLSDHERYPLEIDAQFLSWKDYIIKRRQAILTILDYLKDLVRDWSSRVWVVSEFNIAKKKNNLKYWFIGITVNKTCSLPFFSFDFTDPAFGKNRTQSGALIPVLYKRKPSIYEFHTTLYVNLSMETFLRMILETKASKNEDRFHAILPLSKYKDKIHQVTHSQSTTMTSVKLKLFEIMDTRDKCTLLFLCGNYFATFPDETLPTFATSTINWLYNVGYLAPCALNFDIMPDASTITLHRTSDSQQLYYLHLTPMYYYMKQKPYEEQDVSQLKQLTGTLHNYLQLDDKRSLTIDIVRVPYYRDEIKKYKMQRRPKQLSDHLKNTEINLVGSFVENKWILGFKTPDFDPSEWDRHDNNENDTVFNIY